MPFSQRVELTLPAGPIAVVGRHAGDERRSNRAGKSSLLEAITWCLFGQHRKRTDDAIINHASEKCGVAVDIGDLSVNRTRARGSSTKLRVAIAGMEFTGTLAQQEIEKYLGLTFDDYVATSCFRQGDVDAIVSRSASDRLSLVSEWLQQKRWHTAKEIQARKAREIVRSLEEKRSALATEEKYCLVLGDSLMLHAERTQLKKSIEQMQASAEALTTKLLERTEINNQIDRHQELVELRSKTVTLRERLKGRAELVTRLDDARAKYDQARATAVQSASALTELQKMVRVGFEGTCPITCQDCPVRDDVSETIRDARNLLEQRRATALNDEESRNAAEDEFDSLQKQSQDLDRASAAYQQVVERGKELKSSITVTDVESLEELDEEALDTEIDALRIKIANATARVGELTNKLETSDAHEKRRKELVGEVAAIERQSIVANLALRAIVNVPARIAAEQLGELEEEANSLLSGAGVSLRFSWARELSDKAPICNECGFVFGTQRGDECPQCTSPRGKKLAQEMELLCDDGSGVEEDVRFNSGGTKANVGAAMRLAASAMLRRLRASQAAFALVDEPFGSLDAENREQLAMTFAGMLSSVGLEQAFVVSHDPMLLGALPHRLIVDKDSGASIVRLE